MSVAKERAQYVLITQMEMDKTLLGKGFEIQECHKSQELIYDRPFEKFDALVVRVFSSINQNNGLGRDNGQDAIRICLFDTRIDKILGLATRVNRTVGWECRLLTRAREMYLAAKDLRLCGKCRTYYMVVRTNKSTKKDFYSCSGYPHCSFTCEIH